jgi:hypothetical protein
MMTWGEFLSQLTHLNIATMQQLQENLKGRLLWEEQ